MSQSDRSWTTRPCQSGVTVFRGRLAMTLDVLFYAYGDRGSTVVKALRYESEGCWFDSRWCQWNISLT